MYLAIVDDVEDALEILTNIILKYTEKFETKIDCFTSARSFLESHSLHKYDALFLDIDMPDITGFKLTDILHENKENIPIVFVTGRDDLITNAFRYKPVGFVRKQHLEAEMKFAIETVIAELNTEYSFISFTEPKSYGGKTHKVKINDILYLRSLKHYIEINLIDNSVITIRDKISRFFNNPAFSDFVLIDAGTLANLAHIKVIDNTAVFPNNRSLYISRRRIRSVLQAYMQYSRKVLI